MRAIKVSSPINDILYYNISNIDLLKLMGQLSKVPCDRQLQVCVAFGMITFNFISMHDSTIKFGSMLNKLAARRVTREKCKILTIDFISLAVDDSW